MTKQELNEIITSSITTQIQKPVSALKSVTDTYGVWLRKVVKNAQMKANQAKSGTSAENEASTTQSVSTSQGA